MRRRQRQPHLRLPLDGVHPVDELAVGLEEQQQLEVEFVESATQLQLLQRQRRHARKDRERGRETEKERASQGGVSGALGTRHL